STNNTSTVPGFTNASQGDYSLASSSACIDAGDPAVAFRDQYFPKSLGTVVNDQGFTGGAFASGYWSKPSITTVDLRPGIQAAKALWINSTASTQDGVLVLRATDA